MNRLKIPAMVKFAFGILLVQGATVLLVIAAQQAALREIWLLMLGLGLMVGLMATFWFSSIASHCKEQILARANAKFHKERERIRRQSDREKTKELKESHRQLLRETKRGQSRSNVKLGAVALTGLATVGVALFFAQFMTLGLLAVSLTGGALLGYGVRARQKHLPGRGKALPGVTVEQMPNSEQGDILLPPVKKTPRKAPS